MKETEFDWDDQKSEQLATTRGYSMEEIVPLFRGDYAELLKNDNPQQFIAIGYLGDTMISVIYEEREDESGVYVWLITYWKSTQTERKAYEQHFRGRA